MSEDVTWMNDCRKFLGSKPCPYFQVLTAECSQNCAYYDQVKTRILIVHLGAMGAVVRSTSLLKAIKKKYEKSHITWVTESPMNQLLENHPSIDRVLTSDWPDLLTLTSLRFDVSFCIDKSLKASGVLALSFSKATYGFLADSITGAIIPANPHAKELWEIGLDNRKKFFTNQKTENQLIHEALELGPYTRDPYDLVLSKYSLNLAFERRQIWRINKTQPIIGLNTGCGSEIPYKKWSVSFHRHIIPFFAQKGFENIVLLGGGEEDHERNTLISFKLPVIASPAQNGPIDGLASIEACDIVISGDSFGMHLAIAQKKFVIAWFGPTCKQEIDLYDNGIKLKAFVPCSPCWKRNCDKTEMCYDSVSIKDILSALDYGVQKWKEKDLYSLSKQPSSEISY